MGDSVTANQTIEPPRLLLHGAGLPKDFLLHFELPMIKQTPHGHRAEGYPAAIPQSPGCRGFRYTWLSSGLRRMIAWGLPDQSGSRASKRAPWPRLIRQAGFHGAHWVPEWG
jgi:hypothetical protein